MVHNFKLFPELTNNQMQFYYFESPHKQITEDFTAKVVKVTDGDTIRVEVDFRDFNFPIRLARIAAPETNEVGGLESQRFLSERILGEEVEVKLTKQRVEKWGRLLAEIFFMGMNLGQASIDAGYSVMWEARQKAIPDFNKQMGRIWK